MFCNTSWLQQRHSKPLLNDNTTFLELMSLAQNGSLVSHVLVGESGHESIRSAGASSIGTIDKVVNVTNGVSGVET